MAELKAMRTVFYRGGKNDDARLNGPIEMHAIDAHNAVMLHPKEYSYEPWDGSEGPNLPNGELRPIVPTGWVDLKPSERIDLARQLGGQDIRSGARADEFINNWLVDRANAGATPTDRTNAESQVSELREEKRSADLEEDLTGKKVTLPPNPLTSGQTIPKA